MTNGGKDFEIKYDALQPNSRNTTLWFWGIDSMGPFPNSFGNQYILVVVDYVSKWVKAIPSKSNENTIVVKFLKENNFSCFGTLRAIISDNGSHFCNKTFKALMRKYLIDHQYCIFTVIFPYYFFNKLCYLITFCPIICRAFTKWKRRENEPKSLLKFRLNQNSGWEQMFSWNQSKSGR